MVLIEFETAFLLLLIQQDESAFNTFYLKTVDIFFRYLKTNYFLDQEECEDIIADFYVKFRNAVKSYDIEQSFSAYTWTIFKNALKDYFKKTKEIRFSQLDSPNPDFWQKKNKQVNQHSAHWLTCVSWIVESSLNQFHSLQVHKNLDHYSGCSL